MSFCRQCHHVGCWSFLASSSLAATKAETAKEGPAHEKHKDGHCHAKSLSLSHHEALNPFSEQHSISIVLLV